MAVNTLFATHLFDWSLAEDRQFGAFNADLKEACALLVDGDDAGHDWSEENAYFGYTSYASLDDLPARASAFAALRERLASLAEEALDALGYELGGRKLVMDSLWVNVLEPGGQHSGHIHPNSVLSGTYYVEVPDGAGAIKFEDPRLAMMMNTPTQRKDVSDLLKRFFYVTPKVGQVLMWESWLRHEVMLNLAETPRISISFNYSVE